MNLNSENNLLVVIIFFLLLVIFFLIVVMTFIIYKLLKKNDQPSFTHHQTDITPKETNPKFKKLSSVSEKFFCQNHPDEQSVGSCLICEEVFCEKCLIEHDSLYFCQEHFKVFANNKWVQISDVKTTPDSPEAGLHIYDFKRKIWSETNTPSFVVTHYKINIDEDFIESFIQLHVLEDQAETLLENLNKKA